MPKIFETEVAVPIEDVLENIERSLEQKLTRSKKNTDISENIASVINYVRGHINRTVCLNSEQQEALIQDFEDICRRNFNISDLQQLTSMINTMRFDCAYCLNNDCNHRNPDFPYESVEI